jgi:hypothetical protein
MDKLVDTLKQLESGDMLIYVPPNSRVEQQLVRHYHEEVTAHGSLNMVEITIQKFWLVSKLTRVYKDVRQLCKNCKFVDAKLCKLPEGNLMSERIDTRYPFEVTGTDFTGPFDVLRDERRKLYICIFADAYTRAVSLFVIPDKSYGSFLQAFEKFKFAHCVRPAIIRSDNDKTFETASMQEKLRTQCYETEWHFNPPLSGWWGAMYERMIRMIKEKIARCFNRQRFDSFLDFEVAVKYVEAIINNRPLYARKDPISKRYTVIRPADFLHPNRQDDWFDEEMTNVFSKRTEEAASARQLDDRLRKQIKFQKRVKLLFDECYVNSLRTFHQNKFFENQKAPEQTLKVGDAVLIKPTTAFKENSLFSKLKWPVGEITEVYKDPKTNWIRFLDVTYTQDGKEKFFTKHPVQHFAPLEMPLEEARGFLAKTPAIPDPIT